MTDKINEDQKSKLKKVLSGVTFCSISTCSEGVPHTTMVQPSVTSELNVVILAKKTRKKITNIQQNNQVWLTFDATGLLKIPKVVYVKGKAELEPLNQEIEKIQIEIATIQAKNNELKEERNSLQKLIKEGKRVGEASYLVGYNNLAQFSREYKRQFGFAPSAT